MIYVGILALVVIGGALWGLCYSNEPSGGQVVVVHQVRHAHVYLVGGVPIVKKDDGTIL